MPLCSLEDARGALRAHFGYADFRPPQVGAVQAVLSGRDALIVLPTGGGKSVCFQVPALLMPGLTLVVSPLISLMVDQVEALQRRSVAAEYLNSALDARDAARRLARVQSGEVKLLYLAPERLTMASMVAELQRRHVSLLVVDEAHCVSEWGHDFRPSYLRIADARRMLGMPQTIALTATATPHVRRDVRSLLGLRNPVELVSGFDRPNLRFGVEHVPDERAREEAAARLLSQSRGTSVVYAATRRQVEHVVRALQTRRMSATGYHAGLSPERRASAQDAFMSGAVPTIVATNAFGMGIDKSDVRLVVHYAMSGSLEDYYQEAGRAGRDGAWSRCVLLYHPADRYVHDRFRESSFPAPALVRRVYASLAAAQSGGTALRLDHDAIAATMKRASSDGVRRGVAYLREQRLLAVNPSGSAVRLRLLASPLRAVCEEPSLHGDARQLFRRLLSDGSYDWVPFDPESLGISPFRLRRASEELEERQLAYRQPDPEMGQLKVGRAAEAGLDAALARLARRRACERAKLDAVVAYATTRSCRRDHILRYFGDTSQRAPCARCDNCHD